MSISEKLKKVHKKAKTLAMTGALAVAAIAAPIKGQSAEAVPEREPARTVDMPHRRKMSEKEILKGTADLAKQVKLHIMLHDQAQEERRQKFEKAVRAGAPKEEIAKYINFPEFIPVTRDGKFDQKKADEWAKKLAPYMKTLAEKGETVSAAEAYKAFKESTCQINVSLEDFERVCTMTQEALKKNKDKKSEIPIYLLMVSACVAAAYGLGKLTRSAAKEGMDAVRFNETGHAVFNFGAAGASALLSLSMAFASATGTYNFVDSLKSTPEREVSKIYSRMYDSHVDNTIKAQQKQFHQLEWAQAKELIEKTQGRK